MMKSERIRKTLLELARALLLAQPVFTFPVFISILHVGIPLWLAWIIAVIPWPLRFIVTGRLSCRTPFDIPIIISLFGMVLGFFLSPDRQLAMTALHSYLACVLLYYGVVNNSRAPMWYWISTAAFLSLVLLSLSLMVFQGGIGKYVVFNTWAYELASKLSWPITTKIQFNVLGGAFAVVIPALVSIAFFLQRGWIRVAAGILALVFTFILVLSASSGGWIATVAGVMVVLFFRGTKTFWSSMLVSGTSTGATFPFWHSASWVGVVFSVNSLLGRFKLWRVTLVALKDSPLAGLGLGGWVSKVPVENYDISPHNAYLQLYSDTGILGFVAFIISAVVSFRIFWQILHCSKDSLYYGVALGIAAGVISGGIFALVDVNTIVMIPVNEGYLFFAVPFLWLWAALLVVSHQHLMAQGLDNRTLVLL
jgi:O-antigen ligase